MTVAVQQPQGRQKKDPLEVLAQGLGIAQSITGIKSNMATLDAHQKAQDDQAALKDRMKRGEYTPQEMASLSKDYKIVDTTPETKSALQAFVLSADGTKKQVSLLPNTKEVKTPNERPQEYAGKDGKPRIGRFIEGQGLVMTPNDPQGYVKPEKPEKTAPKDYAGKLAALNASEKARFDHVRSYAKAVDDLEISLAKGGSRYSPIGDNDFTAALDRAAESYGRMQSGGAINKDEEARFKNMIRALGDDGKRTLSKISEARREADSRFETLGFKSSEVPEMVASRSNLEKALVASKNKSAPGTAIAAPSSKPKEVIQNGWVYDAETLQPIREAK